VAVYLTETSGIEQHCEETKMRLLIVGILLEQAQCVPHGRLGVASVT
jgi:hypothetical protein